MAGRRSPGTTRSGFSKDDPMFLSAIGRRLWSNAWLVLGYMAFVSGANGVAARLARDEVPPLMLVVLRWAIVCLTLACLLDASQRRELAALIRAHWRRLGWMGLFGYAGFNALFYLAAYHTSAVNLTLLQSAIPALVLAGAALVLGMRIRAAQVVGMGLTFLGVLVISTKGDLAHLSSFRLDIGDAAVLLACLFYAAYTLGLRSRPPGAALVFFAGMALASLVAALPMGAAEIATGHAFWPTPKGWLVTLFIAFGPSFTGQLCFMRGVDLIGPARAGLTANLIPMTGALCAVVVLGEAFTLADAVALGLGLGGIALSEWSARGASRRTVRSDVPAQSATDPGLP